MVLLVKRFPMRHGGGQRVVLQQKAERPDAMLARDGDHALQHINVAKLRRAQVRNIQRNIFVVLHVRQRIIAAVKFCRLGSGAMRLVGVHERKQRVHPGALPHVVEHRVQLPLRERGNADGHGHRGGGRFGCSRSWSVFSGHGFHTGERRAGTHNPKFDKITSVHAASIPRSAPPVQGKWLRPCRGVTQ